MASSMGITSRVASPSSMHVLLLLMIALHPPLSMDPANPANQHRNSKPHPAATRQQQSDASKSKGCKQTNRAHLKHDACGSTTENMNEKSSSSNDDDNQRVAIPSLEINRANDYQQTSPPHVWVTTTTTKTNTSSRHQPK